MRHYDRAEFRHLDDAQRYRDHEYKADDGWVGPNEHAPDGVAPARSGPRSDKGWRSPRRPRRAFSLFSRVVDAVLHPRRALGLAARAVVRTVAQRMARARPQR
jgi:hypothetical protein